MKIDDMIAKCKQSMERAESIGVIKPEEAEVVFTKPGIRTSGRRARLFKDGPLCEVVGINSSGHGVLMCNASKTLEALEKVNADITAMGSVGEPRIEVRLGAYTGQAQKGEPIE